MTIRIYVACLASYNNGELHGAWIDACQDVTDIHVAIQTMLKTSPIEDAEEYAIHDYEGFEGADVCEYQGIESVAELAGFIEEHDKLGAELINHFCGDLEQAQTAMDDHYYGAFKSVAEFAEEITEETTTIPDSLQFYIDYEAMARDLEISDIFTIEAGFEDVHIFCNH